MTGIFDSHAHYDDSAFDEDRDLLLASMESRGVTKIVNCASDINSSFTSLALAEKYPFIYAACGVHPHEASECADDFVDVLKGLLKKPECVAIGEIGLDYHYDFSPRERQIQVLRLQLELARETDTPIIFHDREAHEDTLNLLREYKPRGVVHCFSGSVEMAKEIIALGMYIGLGGAVTFKNARKPCEVAASVPEDRILVETDCPYMTPVPFRGTRNDSSYIPYTAEKLAEIRGVSPQEICDITARNASELFKIS